MIQKIAFGILAFALAIAAVTVVAGNVLSYGWKESLPDVGWAAAIALAYALLARLLARGLFFRIRPTVRNVLSLALQDAVARLNERERQIIRMRFYEGQTQMEVAREIGISQAQVSRLEKSALRSMRNYLSDER